MYTVYIVWWWYVSVCDVTSIYNHTFVWCVVCSQPQGLLLFQVHPQGQLLFYLHPQGLILLQSPQLSLFLHLSTLLNCSISCPVTETICVPDSVTATKPASMLKLDNWLINAKRKHILQRT